MGTKCCSTTADPRQGGVMLPDKRKTEISKFASTLAKLQAEEGAVFEDLEFRADPSSIVAEDDTESPLYPFRNAEWKKAQDIDCLKNEDGSLSLYFDQIEPGDILVGNCPDGNFLSAVSGLAEVPERIQELFL